MISIDLTRNYNVTVDSTGMHGPTSYIDIVFPDKCTTDLRFTLENIILNLNDNLTSIINASLSQTQGQVKENGIMIIKKADVVMSNIKGINLEITHYKENDIVTTSYRTWQYDLRNNDRIYEISGISKNSWDTLYGLYAVSSEPNVTMTFASDAFEWYENYAEFSAGFQRLNAEYKARREYQKGKLLDRDFFNANVLHSVESDEYIVNIKHD